MLGQMKPSSTVSMYGKSLKFLHFILIEQQTWLSRIVLVKNYKIQTSKSSMKIYQNPVSRLGGDADNTLPYKGLKNY